MTCSKVDHCFGNCWKLIKKYQNDVIDVCCWLWKCLSLLWKEWFWAKTMELACFDSVKWINTCCTEITLAFCNILRSISDKILCFGTFFFAFQTNWIIIEVISLSEPIIVDLLPLGYRSIFFFFFLEILLYWSNAYFNVGDGSCSSLVGSVTGSLWSLGYNFITLMTLSQMQMIGRLWFSTAYWQCRSLTFIVYLPKFSVKYLGVFAIVLV